MARRFNMVSEQFPPLMANMATVGNNSAAAGNNTTGTGINGAQTPSRNHTNQDLVFFNHIISIRLNDHNFFLWKQQILAAIKGNRLMKYITKPPPPYFLNEEGAATMRESIRFMLIGRFKISSWCHGYCHQ
uniref:Retrotransposon Copia-like N-terminal domain-containing protein n=1 Tax=Cannabis sativa TaxID=3483 RepID=A0A803NSZ7_CANSA